MEQVQALVIGGGVVGLAVAAALARSGHETVLAEAETAIGQGISSRNSEVLHAGLYYAPGSWKARLCVQGNRMLYDWCAGHGVPHRRCGKLIVATDESQHPKLQSIAERAAAAGVVVEPMSVGEVRLLEPELRCTAALWSPSSGIVDSHALMVSLQGELERGGGAVALASRVVGASCAAGRPTRVRLRTPEGESEVDARIVVNAAGLGACMLAARFEGLAAEHVPQGHFAKGSYFSLSARSPFSHLIYPVPVDAWLGVHVTLDLAGQARFGPDLEWLAIGQPEDIDYAVDMRRAAGFEEAIRRYWPGLPDAALLPAYSGVRPKIHAAHESAPDFRIDGPARHGVPGLVNLFGIESPGLTSSLALAEAVVRLLEA